MTTPQVSGSTRRQAVLGELPRTLPADDERDLSNLIRMALRDEGWGIDVAHHAAEFDHIVAQLRSVLCRSAYPTPARDEPVTVGDLVLDDASRTVTRAGSSISLTSTEFELLRYLMLHQGRAVSRKEILARVWNYDFGGRSGIVDLYVSYLRKKVDAGRAPMIHTVRGVGYLLRSAE
ncbi:two-component system response regulator TrcR [Mycobacterium sp. AZCC_0083]|nr:winged helix-turn-helix domain-containing protein [Mycobacterium sp. AZCC_0083]MBB5166259.1 two-component system response regulator TrcR [Mycobacterium sp. AZCC_0083]